MGGRGRGGPGKSMSLNVEALGFGRGTGNAMPTAMLQPPPMFPPLDNQPLPLDESDQINYLVELKQDLQNFMEDSPYHLEPLDTRKDIARYSDKYRASQTSKQTDPIIWSRLPTELWPASQKPKVKKKKKDVRNILKSIEDLERKEAGTGNESAAEDQSGDSHSDSGDDKNEEGDVDKEEEAEEDNDYLAEYFDNGETFGDADEDGLDDDATY